MTTYEYGNMDALTVLIQPVEYHDLSGIDREIASIREVTNENNFRLFAVKVQRWNL
ncbi:MAG: hypothetical protein IKF90_20540 [Parasporobacterium sp.]|nr:hypothetical protein [Parasporobacterium sp.]